MLKQTLFVATVVAGVALAAAPAYADDWGCEVLMCSMSNNPTWPGVPSCIPPMTRLVNAMNAASLFNPFRWPIWEGQTLAFHNVPTIPTALKARNLSLCQICRLAVSTGAIKTLLRANQARPLGTST